jgi:hypothetical protein
MGSDLVSRYLDYKWEKVHVYGKLFACHYILYLMCNIYFRDWMCNAWWLFVQLSIEVF